LTIAVVAAALVAVGSGFALGRPTYHRAVTKPPSDHGLPYTVAKYTAADARRAFKAIGITLTPRSRSATAVTQGSPRDVLEVDAFRDRKTVEQAGFWDYAIVADGQYVHFPTSCGSAIPSAERWHGNVRVLVSCKAAGSSAAGWLRRVDSALARLR